MTNDDLVTIDRFLFLPDAEIARATLEAAGIEAVLIDENTVRMSWGDAQAHGGVRLQVRGSDAEEAREILAAELSAERQPAEPLDEDDERCHRCGSGEIYPAESRSKTYARIVLLAVAGAVLARFIVGVLVLYGLRDTSRIDNIMIAVFLLGPFVAVIIAGVAPRKRCRNCGLEWRGKQRTA